MNDDEPTRQLQPVTPGQLERGETLPVLAEPAIGGPSSPALRIGTQVGRYLLEDELGRGGMGVVYAAHDPQLDRRVAIKLLRSHATEGTEGRARLLREAQALAKLAHPNVIAVFDVGTVGADVFVAMELTTGGTLRGYQRGKPWRDVVRAYVDAGRGLAAAHAAGLVHRDFKPDNVLVGGDGRMRVTDFGLVRAADAPPVARADAAATVPGRRPGPPASDRLSSSLTEAGSVMGTPLYMAPEQMAGGDIGPAADQFAFAVALWQALHGDTPFSATDLPARRAQIVGGERAAPTNRAVPARVTRALERALAAEPAARWPDMAALLAALERALHHRRTVAWAWGGAGAVVVGAAAVALTARGGAPGDRCARADAPGVGLWTARKAAIAEAFAATGAPYAAASLRLVDDRLTSFERSWRLARIDACRADDPRAADPIATQRAACLTVRRLRAVAVIDGLAAVDRERVAAVPQLLAALPRLDDCVDPQVLAGLAPRPAAPEVARALTVLEGRLTTLDAPASDAPAAAYDQAVADARQLGYAPIEAEALIVRASHGLAAGHVDAARKDLIDAAAAATRGGDRARLAEAYLALVDLDDRRRGDLDAAASWVELAAAAVDALGRPVGKRIELAQARAALARDQGDPGRAAAAVTPLLDDPAIAGMDRFELEGTLALALTDQGKFVEAEAVYARLVPAVTAAVGAEHPYALRVATNRATLDYHRGRYADCRAAQARLVEVRARVLGRDHVEVADNLEALAACENKSGHAADALGHFEQAVAILKAARGADHPRTLDALSDLGGAYSHLGRHDRALAINREILAARERTLGPDHVDVAISLVNTAIEAKNSGDVVQAIALQERAIKIFEKALGKDHPNVGIALINYGEALRAGARPDDATAAFVRAGAIIGAAMGPEHPIMAHVYYGRGMTELSRGHAAAAVSWLERAVARRSGADHDPNELAEAELGLARALVAARGDRARARSLAEHAIATWTAAGDGFAAQIDEARRWLAGVR